MGKWLNDLKCTLIQKAVYAKFHKGHKPNEWEPWHEPEVKKLGNGMICRSDVKYGETWPNSYADIWYPDDSGKKRPVVVYFHGGGFIFGNKSSGDPMQTGGGGVGKLEAIVKAGYILVNADYALAPQYRFPVPIRVENPDHVQNGVKEIQVDGERVGRESAPLLTKTILSGRSKASVHVTMGS